MKTIKGDWIMEKDEIIEESLTVEGKIYGKDSVRYSLIVKGDLNCIDLNCWDLNCGDLNCRDLNFYACCFAYQNIKCKSIKGKRENSKYFVLDGKIIIDGVEQK